MQQVNGRLMTTPGVESAAFMEGGEGLVWSWDSGRAVQVSRPDQREQSAHAGLTVRRQDVSPNFFHTLRTPLLQGREFTQQDRPGVPQAAIINEALAAS